MFPSKILLILLQNSLLKGILVIYIILYVSFKKKKQQQQEKDIGEFCKTFYGNCFYPIFLNKKDKYSHDKFSLLLFSPFLHYLIYLTFSYSYLQVKLSHGLREFWSTTELGILFIGTLF